MSLLDRIRDCQRWDRSRYRPFRIAGQTVGWVTGDFAGRLVDFPEVFTVAAESVDLDPRLADFESRTRAVGAVLERLRAEGLIKGWRDEAYAVGTSFADAMMAMERAAVPLFGVRAYGIHVNGYVGSGDTLKLWVARRAKNKQTAPGKLDHLIAGGQPAGLSLTENLLKESAEEASLPRDLALTARPAGFVSYITEREEGLRNDICFVYDIALPESFTPRNTDGEIEAFQLWPIAEVRERMAATEDFKFNVALVNIDFLVRRGYLAPEDPDYIEIVEGLRL
jgi:hypothetical protein